MCREIQEQQKTVLMCLSYLHLFNFISECFGFGASGVLFTGNYCEYGSHSEGHLAPRLRKE